MDQTMTQLLASQLGLRSENGDLQPSEIVAALASRVSESNPLMASLITQMASQKQAADERDRDDYRDDEHEIQRLKQINGRLRRQVASAQMMARYIADIFGACPACWGLNRLCERCQGRGLPGYANPNFEELRAWVEPALKKGGFHIAPRE